MKNIRYYIAVLALTFSLSSCQDWLTIYPENEQTSDQFWRNKEEVEAVLATGYVRLKETNDFMFVWGESRGNGVVNVRPSGGDVEPIQNQIEQASILLDNKYASWASFYKVINMANSVIKYAPDVVERDQSFNVNAMNSYLSEAYFLRALAYFYLARTFIEIPFVTEPYVTDDVSYRLAATPSDDVLRALLPDLYNAIYAAKEFFPEADPLNRMNTKGRATKWSIYALIADIQLWLGNYQECIEACDFVLESGAIGLIRPTAAEGDTPEIRRTVWFRNFGYADEVNPLGGNSNESIFEIQYSRALSQTSPYYGWFVTDHRFEISQYTLELFRATTLQGDVRGDGATYRESDLGLWKYIGANTNNTARSDTQNENNWIIYRLADIYLMKAEAIVMKDGQNQDNYDEATRDWINPIRTRVGLLAATSATTEAEMLQLILTERQCEFVAEGKNWFDLLRIARRDNYRHKQILLDNIRMRDGGLNAGTSGMIIANLTDNNALYMPIHEDEIKSNDLLVQNPYYQPLGD